MKKVVIDLKKGDITKQKIDAVVNAAHEKLSGGGGVDGAIHKAAGPKLLGECLNLHGCPTGQARITAGYDLPALYVVHTVGPTWRGEKNSKQAIKLLKSCYWKCMALATMQGLKSIAFPCISTGAYAFPKEKACQVAIKTIERFIENRDTTVELVRFVCFDEENYNHYLDLGIEDHEEVEEDAEEETEVDEDELYDPDSDMFGLFSGPEEAEEDEPVEVEVVDSKETLTKGVSDETAKVIKEIKEDYEKARKCKAVAGDKDMRDAVNDDIKKVLDDANDVYRKSGEESPLTDQEYDFLQEQVDDAFKNKVGVEIEKNKIDLPVSMGSLTKVKTRQEISDWTKKKKIPATTEVAVTPKFDGLSLLVKYVDGKYEMAATRGDGKVGQDVTEHFRFTKLGQNKIDGYTGYLIGEAIMKESVFEAKYKDKYKNPRNMVAGVLGRVKITEELKDVDFMAYVAISDDDKTEFATKVEELEFCNKNNNKFYGYEIEVVSKPLKSIRESFLIKHFESITEYQCDGLVIDVNDVEFQEEIGNETNSLNPAYARAWKPESDDSRQTKVTGVTWNPSKIGLMKPVVQIEPVDICGVTISNVTGINARYIDDNKIAEGAFITVIRSGDVIPKITKVLVGAKNYSLIENCSVCNTELEWNEYGGKELVCINENCRGKKLSENVDFFVKMDVDEVGEGVIKQLYDEGITDVASILAMSIEDFEKVEGFKRRKAEKVYREIHSKMNDVSLEKVQHASNLFVGLGSRKLASLVEYDSPDKVPTQSEIEALEGFSMKSAESYLKGIEKFWKWLDKLPITIKKYQPPKVGVLTGKSFVFTGGKPKDMITKIEDLGGKVGSSVGKKTFALVAKASGSGSSKETKAQSLGVKVMGWDDLEKFLESSDV